VSPPWISYIGLYTSSDFNFWAQLWVHISWSSLMPAFSTVSSCLHKIAMNISGATLRFESLLPILHKKTALASAFNTFHAQCILITSWELGIPKALVQMRPSIPTLSSIYRVLILACIFVAWVIWHWILMCNPSCSAKRILFIMFCMFCWIRLNSNVAALPWERKYQPAAHLTLRSVWSLNNTQNSEMKFCENIKLTC